MATVCKTNVEVTRDKLWRLKKAIYGLNDAARVSYLKVKEELGKMGAIKSKHDEAIFYWKKDAVLQDIIACHVDDFIFSRTALFMDSAVRLLKQKFKVSAEGEHRFTYIGLQIDQNAKYITVSQKEDKNIKPITIPDDVAMTDPLDKIQQWDLKSFAGKLNWISTYSGPDNAYDVCQTNNSTKEVTVKDLVNANKARGNVKSEEVELIFPNLGDVNKVEFLCFADASLGNLRGNASQGGYITFLLGEEKRYAPITWQSKKIR